jgi:hypothetical protein
MANNSALIIAVVTIILEEALFKDLAAFKAQAVRTSGAHFTGHRSNS